MKTLAQQALFDIKARAEAAGFKISDVCRVAEIDQSQVSRWANGVTEPLYSAVARLQQAVDALVAARLQKLAEAQKAQQAQQA
jgi:transcriptional regulator with XRE-family HTH domain